MRARARDDKRDASTGATWRARYPIVFCEPLYTRAYRCASDEGFHSAAPMVDGVVSPSVRGFVRQIVLRYRELAVYPPPSLGVAVLSASVVRLLRATPPLTAPAIRFFFFFGVNDACP